MSRICAAFLVAFVPMGAFCLDLSVDIGMADKAYFRYSSEPGPRQTESVAIGQSFGDKLYVDLELWHSNELSFDGASICLPGEQDYALRAAYDASLASLGLSATLYSNAARTRFDVAASADRSFPLVGDILALDASIKLITDLAGVYGEVGIGPSLCLPLGRPILVRLTCTLGAMALGYDGIDYGGLSTLTVQPSLSAQLSDATSLSLFGGYCFDLSLGVFSPYPFFGAACSFSFFGDS